MAFRSILFQTTDQSTIKEAPEEPACFADLNLDQVIKAITASKQEYDLKRNVLHLRLFVLQHYSVDDLLNHYNVIHHYRRVYNYLEHKKYLQFQKLPEIKVSYQICHPSHR